MEISSFDPPKRLLMGPGPSEIHPKVLSSLSKPTLGHLDPLFISMMDEVKFLLQYAFQTKNEFTIPISAPGSAGMEACFVNLVEQNDEVLVCSNGVFGERMAENVIRAGGKLIKLDFPWGTPVDPNIVFETLKKNPNIKILSFVHAETSTGVSSDAETLSKIAYDHDCLSIVDTVTSLGGIPLKVDDWKLDAVYSGSQKCLSCVPGLSPVSFSEKAVEKIKNRKSKIQSWFLDQSLVMSYWSGDKKRTYHHTAPVNSLYALHESLLHLYNETLEKSWSRHQKMHLKLKDGLEELSIKFVVEEKYRLPQLNTVWIPKDANDANIRKRLLEEFNLEIGGGLGEFAGKAWRIGLMGHTAYENNISFVLNALRSILQ